METRRAAFAAALDGLPWVVERLARGQQFNVFEHQADVSDGAYPEGDDDDFAVAIGPITDCAVVLVTTPRAKAELIASALTLAALDWGRARQ